MYDAGKPFSDVNYNFPTGIKKEVLKINIYLKYVRKHHNQKYIIKAERIKFIYENK